MNELTRAFRYQMISELPHSVYFDSAQTSALIRRAHGEVTALGGMRSCQDRNLDHCSHDGSPKFIACTRPLTRRNVVGGVIADSVVFESRDRTSDFRLIELAPGVVADDVAARNTATYP